MPTILQIEANRRNAQNSTGPRTDQGKAVSRFNALKTGIDARSHVIPGEDPNVLETLALDYYERFQPTAPEQRFLIDAMVSAEWQLRRLRKTEAQIWEYGMHAWRPQEKLVDSARAYFDREEFLTRLPAPELGSFPQIGYAQARPSHRRSAVTWRRHSCRHSCRRRATTLYRKREHVSK
jgi:hypothetical protein